MALDDCFATVLQISEERERGGGGLREREYASIGTRDDTSSALCFRALGLSHEPSIDAIPLHRWPQPPRLALNLSELKHFFPSFGKTTYLLVFYFVLKQIHLT